VSLCVVSKAASIERGDFRKIINAAFFNDKDNVRLTEKQKSTQ
jgi:hypothetical protein